MTAPAYQHPAFPQPPTPDAPIWRYLTRTKYEWLVNEGRLFMANASNLGDPLEGTQPAGDASWWEDLARRAISDDQRQIIENNRRLISRFAHSFRRNYYVSCWHMNEGVNPQMWNLYARAVDSVAIRTTVAKLRRALPAYIQVGVIRYIDFGTERLPTLNMLEYIMHKDASFAHETELRAVAMHPAIDGADKAHFESNHWESESDPRVIVFAPPVRVSDLIEEIVLHPDASPEFNADVETLRNQHALPPATKAVW